MRILILMGLIVGLGFFSCKEYQLKQPAYLNFKWDFFGQASGPQQPVITGGYFYIKKVNVHGSREEGPQVDIEQELPIIAKTIFSSSGSLGVSMDVPVGDYTDFEVSLKVVEEAHPCMVLAGMYDFGNGNTIPFKIEWATGKDLAFHPNTGFTLKKKKSYNAIIGVDVQKLFGAVTTADWDSAIQTLEGTQMTIVISKDSNPKILDSINNHIASALLLKID
jgi:hypothetical protein